MRLLAGRSFWLRLRARNGARTMCGLLVKCAALTVMIHGFRLLGRLAGPRWSALALGLPSTTAVVLFVCGCERGSEAATAMAESSLLGLVAAVALPLGYVRAVRLDWRLPAALAAAVGGYLVVASTLGCLPAVGALPRVGLALLAIVSAASWARRVPVLDGELAGATLSPLRAMAVRTVIPATFSLVLWIVQRVAGPAWAGLVSTFPSMSLVVLAVTHLEAGPTEACRIAKVLPAGNSSTLAFLATFHLVSTKIGLTGGMIAGYAAAVASLILIERNDRILGFIRRRADHAREFWGSQIALWQLIIEAQCPRTFVASDAHCPPAPRYLVHKRSRHRGRFAPRVETLAW
jgi:hypothetical protein